MSPCGKRFHGPRIPWFQTKHLTHLLVVPRISTQVALNFDLCRSVEGERVFLFVTSLVTCIEKRNLLRRLRCRISPYVVPDSFKFEEVLACIHVHHRQMSWTGNGFAFLCPPPPTPSEFERIAVRGDRTVLSLFLSLKTCFTFHCFFTFHCSLCRSQDSKMPLKKRKSTSSKGFGGGSDDYETFRYCSGFAGLEDEIENKIIPAIMKGDDAGLPGHLLGMIAVGPRKIMRGIQASSSEMAIIAALFLSFEGATMLASPPDFVNTSEVEWVRAYFILLVLAVLLHTCTVLTNIFVTAAVAFNSRDSDIYRAFLSDHHPIHLMDRCKFSFILGTFAFFGAAFISSHESYKSASYNETYESATFVTQPAVLTYDSIGFIVLAVLVAAWTVYGGFANNNAMPVKNDGTLSDFHVDDLAPGLETSVAKPNMILAPDKSKVPIVSSYLVFAIKDLRKRVAMSKRMEAEGKAIRKAGCDALGCPKDVWTRPKQTSATPDDNGMQGFGFGSYDGDPADTMAAIFEHAGIDSQNADKCIAGLKAIGVDEDVLLDLPEALVMQALEKVGVLNFGDSAKVLIATQQF